MNILITGSKGFVGQNLIAELNNIRSGKAKRILSNPINEIFECDIDTNESELEKFCKECDFVIHLAGVNRPINSEEFMDGNFGFTTELLNKLNKYSNKSPILMSSSIQAELNNEYGKSKKAGEDYLSDYGMKNNVKTFIFRLPNVFGKWCRPNYNSVVATFCHNIANDLPIQINNREHEMTLVYIDDVVEAFIDALEGKVIYQNGFCEVETQYKAKLGQIADYIYDFKKSRISLNIPDFNNMLIKKLYSTYLSYLPENSFGYALETHSDNRGSFTEFLHTLNNGQVSINISKPHIIKGQHWHHTKNEKFLVVKGNGVIRFRKINSDKIIEYYVSGEKLEVVDIPCGYTHNIENLGAEDMVTVMWCNEIFDNENPDTYFMEV